MKTTETRRELTERMAQAVLLIIVLAAAFLRFYRLDGQSLWADEGNSVALAGRDLATIAKDAARDIHPPLYYWLLHLWVLAFGRSEVAVRSLSALLGTALVCLTSLLGRRLFDRRVGLAAAFLSALSPFQVYYSQEARMYILAALLGALSVYFFTRMLDSGKTLLNTLLIILFTALGLYTHHCFFLIMAVENLVYLLWLVVNWGRVGRRELGCWLAIQLAVVALYLPWLPITYRQLTRWPPISQAYSLSFIASEALRLYSLGPTVERGGLTIWLMAGFLLIFLAGLFSPNLRINSDLLNLRIHLLLYCLSPVLLMCILALIKPTYRPKFFLIGSPAFYLLLARGMFFSQQQATGARRLVTHYLLPAACLFFVGTASAISLHNYYFDPAYARDDYRGIVRYISARENEGDAILLNAPGQWDVFTYYYQGPRPIHPLPRSRPLDEDSTAEELEEMATRYDRIFTILWATDESDPGRFVEGWLDTHAYKAMDTWYGNVRLAVYAVPPAAPSTEIQNRLQVTLGDEVALLGYNLPTDRVRSGEILQLTLFWQALTRPEERHKVFVQVLDEANHIVGQRDSEPGGGAKITTIWQPGQVIADNYGVIIRPGTPPGSYRLQVGMYELDSGRRLLANSEDKVVLQPIEVLRPEEPPPLAVLDIQHRKEIGYGKLALLGYDLHKLGWEHQPEAPLYPGDVLHLSLYWKALRTPEVEFRLNLKLMDRKEDIWWAAEGTQPAGQGYPTTQWRESEVVRGQFHIVLPAEAPPGRYRVWAQLVPEGGKPLQPPLVSDWFMVR